MTTRFSAMLVGVLALAVVAPGSGPLRAAGGNAGQPADHGGDMTMKDHGAAEFDQEAALEHSLAAVGNLVGDYRFEVVDEQTRRLSDFRGRPLVISLIYTSCHHTCPMLTQNLARVVEVARAALGDDSFHVVSIGFDTAIDRPTRMHAFATAQRIDAPNWDFLSADPSTISRLVDDLGFIYYASPKGFDHLAQTTLLDAEGVVYRQIYGADFDAPALVEPLKQLAYARPEADPNTVSGWINRVRLFCTLYDPAQDRYRFDYSLFIGIAIGLVSLGVVAIFLVRAWLQVRPSRPIIKT